MYLKCHSRTKDGKTHRYWSIAEMVPGTAGRRFEGHVLYLGEISDPQRTSWERLIAVFDEGSGETRQMSLFPDERRASVRDGVSLVLSGFSLPVRVSGERAGSSAGFGICSGSTASGSPCCRSRARTRGGWMF